MLLIFAAELSVGLAAEISVASSVTTFDDHTLP